MRESEEVIEAMRTSVVKMINGFRTMETDEGTQQYAEAVMELLEEMEVLDDRQLDYAAFLEEVFGEDVMLHSLVLSALFFLFQRKEQLQQLDLLLLKESMPYDNAVGLRKELKGIRFQNPAMQSEYALQRRIQSFLTERLKGLLGDCCTRIPYEERNHGCIVLATDQFLGESHAPTKMVLEIADCLQNTLGYQVIILVNIERLAAAEMAECWLAPQEVRYISEYNGKIQYPYRGNLFSVWQYFADTEHLEQLREEVRDVAELRPEFVWHIGGDSVISDIFAGLTTLLEMPCVSGYSVSDAQVMISANRLTGEEGREQERYIAQCRQKRIEVEYYISCNMEENGYCREDLGFAKDAFVVAIVGNRLDEEITEEVQGILEKLVREEPHICFAVIGERTRRWSEELERHVKDFGYREDFVKVMSAMQLFFNPPRMGGGNSACVAVRCTVPVVTLRDCDVAVNVGEAFCCEDIAHMQQTVLKCYREPLFYDRMKEMCRKQSALYEQGSAKQICATIVTQTREWLQKGELE